MEKPIDENGSISKTEKIKLANYMKSHGLIDNLNSLGTILNNSFDSIFEA